ncbi:PQQ-dependent sugar dehydrogenase [Aliifodinibius salicampi]|uniref:PQQ-dependent sugar dehydrogenase n=1 Tax=Fodinibius salicampi TaxID=1920655 RepID=A0ABT3PUE0_9BACT|nr:PQQ-dependent sugar dehydrogenase [Fodinibius salicampi]MCW9711464.1 PQQ-dependent sugar dehydrogenase [Fodinibius salicampi]
MNIKKYFLTSYGEGCSNYLTETIQQFSVLFLLVVLFIAGCSESAADKESSIETNPEIVCAADNGGITLPDGFCASLVVDSLGRARHIAVASNGDIYVKTRSEEGGIAALRDTTGDFQADIIERFSDMTPMGNGILWETGMAIHNGYLWASNTEAVYRWPMPEGGKLVPEGEPEIVVNGFPEQRAHASKSITFDESGHLYVAVGAPSNNCQQEPRTPGSPGLDPCPQLERQAGIWRFSADSVGQTQQDGIRYATGIRNIVGLDWNTSDHALYVMQHGRDQLNQLWPDLYTTEDNAELPAEEMLRLTEGANAGWPYCYYDQQQEQKVLSPEYGGDGQEVGRCSEFLDPVAAFPGHWAPNGLMFYTGEHFPEHYRGVPSLLSTAPGTVLRCPRRAIRSLLPPLKMVLRQMITKRLPMASLVWIPSLAEARRNTARWVWQWDRMVPSLSPTPKRGASGAWYIPVKRTTKRGAEDKLHGVNTLQPMFITY